MGRRTKLFELGNRVMWVRGTELLNSYMGKGDRVVEQSYVGKGCRVV